VKLEARGGFAFYVFRVDRCILRRPDICDDHDHQAYIASIGRGRRATISEVIAKQKDRPKAVSGNPDA